MQKATTAAGRAFMPPVHEPKAIQDPHNNTRSLDNLGKAWACKALNQIGRGAFSVAGAISSSLIPASDMIKACNLALLIQR